MARLPQGEDAYIDLRKLLDYCLDLTHEVGQHKARLFRATLDLGRENAEILRAALAEAAVNGEAEEGEEDLFGKRYVIDFLMRNGPKAAIVRSAWIVRTRETFPRLVTCYVLRSVEPS